MSVITAGRVVVLDEHVLTRAFLTSSSTFATYPRPPARSTNEFADALGVTIHHETWGLVVSPSQLNRVGHALAAIGHTAAAIARYIQGITESARLSGGGVFEPSNVPQVDHDRPEVDRALALAVWADADAIVLESWSHAAKDLAKNSRWLSTPAFADHAHLIQE